MTIEILPARLANQIAAGEVVERPASVVKELVENSLDAGATQLRIEIDKGGAKRIKITDNGSGIVKEQLTLALSRHATSKIKNLDDLEAISSLGFRGEALASISSVARLTLTSKPADQEQAWQAMAEGRDMAVNVQPAAHPDGTTIEVNDLFFNTPARRKFLRTEKTEFSHIEEVIKRIALARFDVGFTLVHNGKTVKQYRAAKQASQYSRRVAQVCGQSFIDNALEVSCQHEGLELVGWLAKPSFYRKQNDLCYSYVNGRMMRDKLINHAIRQAYAELLPHESYPAFVLFLNLDYREVDVNVHPAKHEVRFHQGRYVHDFILSVCRTALEQELSLALASEDEAYPEQQPAVRQSHQVNEPSAQYQGQLGSTRYQEYVTPLKSSSAGQTRSADYGSKRYASAVSQQAGDNYQRLMTPLSDLAELSDISEPSSVNELRLSEQEQSDTSSQIDAQVIDTLAATSFVAPHYAVINIAGEVRLLSLVKLAAAVKLSHIQLLWPSGLVSQPLLLPVKLTVSAQQLGLIEQYQDYFKHSGIVLQQGDKSIQIRQFPALLRQQDVSKTVLALLSLLSQYDDSVAMSESQWCQYLAQLMVPQDFSSINLTGFFSEAQNQLKQQFDSSLLLNSVAVDLTSAIHQLN